MNGAKWSLAFRKNVAQGGTSEGRTLADGRFFDTEAEAQAYLDREGLYWLQPVELSDHHPIKERISD
jgi:hypothetical protein